MRLFVIENKISPQLNVAIDLSSEEREKSLDLNIGYSEEFEEWELIIRYTGSLENIRNELGIFVEELLGGYAVLRIPQELIGQLSEYPQINYIEKPKALVFEQMVGITASCIQPIRLPAYNLRGQGTLVACLDSGVDYRHPDFRKEDGTTRIVTMWDQTVPGNPPMGFSVGSVYSAEDINRALGIDESDNEQVEENRTPITTAIGSEIVPEFDGTGHGTAVLGIMAGNGNASGGEIVGVAPEAEIIVVKVGAPNVRGFPRTTQLMTAIDYAIRYAIEVQKPLAINISYGNNYGAHNGDSILERYIDTVSSIHRISVSAGTGNDGITARHKSGTLRTNGEETIEIYAGNYVNSFNLQIWKSYADEIEIELETPTGRRVGPFSVYALVQKFSLESEEIAVYYGEPSPLNPEQEIYISWMPIKDYVTAGIWKIHLHSNNILSGDYAMWLPVAGSTSSEVSFVNPSIYNTLVIPSTAENVISVSAYDSRNDTFANFSGRGPDVDTSIPQRVTKPDLAAPGVAINTCSIGGGYREFTGTSFASPFVAGAAALLMQYGIVENRDPYLYGEKVRASLIRGARQLPFQQMLPSPLVGWGALCVAESLPE